jgi:hypothetical protein
MNRRAQAQISTARGADPRRTSGPSCRRYVAVNRIETTGHVAVTEYFYNPANATCCPTGRATTLWKWTGRTFIPGRTKITSG